MPMSLHDIVALSFEDLPHQTVAAFHQLAAFAPNPAHFSPVAAQAVTEANGTILTTLIARHLLEVDEKHTELSVHQILHDVASKGPHQDAIVRHRHYYLDLVKTSIKAQSSVVFKYYEQIQKAWLNTPDSEELLDWLSAMSTYFYFLGLSQDSLAWNLRARDWAKVAGRTDDEAYLSTEISKIYGSGGRWKDALSESERALSLLRANYDAAGSARVLLNCGVYLRKLKDIGAALNNLEEALKLLEQVDDQSGIKSCLTELAELQSARGKTREAETFRLRALDIVDKSPQKTEVKSTRQIDIATSSSTDRPIYLNLIGNIFSIAQYFGCANDPGLRGKLVIAVNRRLNDTIHHFLVDFHGDGTFTTQWDTIPPVIDAWAEIDEEDSFNMLFSQDPATYEKTFRVSGDIQLFERAFKVVEDMKIDSIVTQENDHERARSLMLLGVEHRRAGELDKALAKLNEAIKIYITQIEVLKEPRLSEIRSTLASCLRERGTTQHDKKQYKEALADFDLSVELERMLTTKGNTPEVDTSANLPKSLVIRALTHQKLEDNDSALVDLSEAIDILTLLSNTDNSVEANRLLVFALRERGELRQLNDEPNALDDYILASDFSMRAIRSGESKASNEDISWLAKTAKLLMDKQKLELALVRYEQMLEFYDRLEENDQSKVSHQMDILNLCVMLYEITGNFDKALQMLDRVFELHKKLLSKGKSGLDTEKCLEQQVHRATLLRNTGKLAIALAELNKTIKQINELVKQSVNGTRRPMA